MSVTLIAEDGHERQHRPALKKLLEATNGLVRIASAYVTDQSLLIGTRPQKQEVRLLTSLTLMDVASGATSLRALGALVGAGIECRSLSEGHRLHAKVYAFADATAVVTSANLTRSALDSNIEVGACVTGASVQALREWFDGLWDRASPIGSAEIAEWERSTEDLRREYAALRKKAHARLKLPGESQPAVHPPALKGSLDQGAGCFVCNTNRRYTPDGRDEDLMRQTRKAAVWTDFRYEPHMKRVKKGDLIFMFAKGVGIIGVGRAEAGCEILPAGDPDRIATYRKGQAEWRVPIEGWLVWAESDDDALPWNEMPNASFLDVSGARYSRLRSRLLKHFLRGP